jgi:hypothetical protein
MLTVSRRSPRIRRTGQSSAPAVAGASFIRMGRLWRKPGAILNLQPGSLQSAEARASPEMAKLHRFVNVSRWPPTGLAAWRVRCSNLVRAG